MIVSLWRQAAQGNRRYLRAPPKVDCLVSKRFLYPIGCASLRKLGSGRLPLVVSLFALGLGFQSCSQAGDASKGTWPDPTFPVQGGSSTGDKEASKTESSSASDADQGGAGSSSPSGPEASSGEKAPGSDFTTTQGGTTSKSSEKASSASSSGEATTTRSSSAPQTTSSSSDENTSSAQHPGTGTEPATCEQELCVEINADAPMGSTRWQAGINMFSFHPPAGARLLSRIELVEGFIRGRTKVDIRMGRGISSAHILRQLSWDVDLPNGRAWRGANLEQPLPMNSALDLWIAVHPIAGSMASIARAGVMQSIFLLPPGQETFDEGRVPVMFRAYCCKE